MATWFWGLAIPATGSTRSPVLPGGVYAELPSARQRTLTLTLDPSQSSSAGFTINARTLEAGLIADLASDLVVSRAGDVLFRGRLCATGDTLDAGRHDTTFAALSYRELLRRRTLASASTLAWSATDQSAIVWSMMDYTQALPGGYLGIGRGLGAAASGTLRTVTYNRGDYIGDNISALASMDAGFDWDVAPYSATDLRLDIVAPSAGVDRGVILEWGSAQVASAASTLDTTLYANVDYLTGDPSVSLTPVLETAADIATRPEGRWESSVATSELVQASLQSRGDYLLPYTAKLVPSWSIVLAKGFWQGRHHIWPGDVLRWRVRSGRLSLDYQDRVTQLTVTPGDSGDEVVTVGLGRIPLTLPRQRKQVQKLRAKVPLMVPGL